MREEKKKVEEALLFGSSDGTDLESLREELEEAKREVEETRSTVQMLQMENTSMEAALKASQGKQGSCAAKDAQKELQAARMSGQTFREEAERLQAENRGLQEAVKTAQGVIENIWNTMETLQGEKARLEVQASHAKKDVTSYSFVDPTTAH
eukprot:gene7869-9344_t